MDNIVAVVISAAVWWIPTFVGLTDLQARQDLPRPVVWKWTALLAVPAIGPAIYYWRGRPALDGDR